MTSSKKTRRDEPTLAEKSLGWAVSGSDMPMREYLNDGNAYAPELEDADEAELQDIMNQLANAQSPGIFLDATFAKLIHEMDELRGRVDILESQNTQMIDFIQSKGWSDEFMVAGAVRKVVDRHNQQQENIIKKTQSDGSGFGLVVSDMEDTQESE